MVIKAGTLLRRVKGKEHIWSEGGLYMVDASCRIYSDVGSHRHTNWIERSIQAGLFKVVRRIPENE